ncbi:MULTISPECIES: OB-fold nucleic acid binding domain-containing protein [Vibrio harveyi group]|uniref:OB-fold nucleic acid binding domain-containing protein n=1 Tax=Vibrio harveyi group TaxID=717610 RepID=UPI001BD42873|nr:hypothetical protein [Vibrio alginolyticus]MBT0032525.1 hypothetical protein [Vibrio alginolyticus]MBY4650366.1 hypothetical protein [Vibrio alginolyticus]
MEFLIFIGICWLVSTVFGGNKSNSSTTNSARNTRNTYNQGRSSHTTPPPQKKTNIPRQSYRPSARTTSSVNPRPTIKFSSEAASSTSFNGNSTNAVEAVDLSGLHDAFTGAPLDKKLGLHQCQNCKVFYHSESITVLLEANSGQCVACHSTQIRAVNVGQEQKSGRDYTPDVITLSNYKDYVGSVVTFEAKVLEVKESRRGSDFAVMFERKSWVQGFKLVFFRSAVRKVGGKPYISTLSGKTVRVRGLVINHPKFGYEIIVSEKSMILSAQ